MREVYLVVALLAAAGQLGLALAAAARLGKSRLAGPVLLLCVVALLWTLVSSANEAEFAQASLRELWHRLDLLISPALPAVALVVIARFTGRRVDRTPIFAAAALGATAPLGLLIAPLDGFVESDSWRWAYLAVALPTLGWAAVLLVRHLNATRSVDERARTRLMLAALTIGWLFGCTEVIADLDERVPRLGTISMLVVAALLWVASLRLELLGEGRLRVWGLFATLSVAALTTVTWIRSGADAVALLAMGAMLMAALGALAWPLLRLASERRTRQSKLVASGRLVQQLAHDLRNPLAAIVGAAQFLEVDLGEDAKAEQREMLGLIVAETRRLSTAIESYRRLGTLQPALVSNDLKTLAERAIATVSPKSKLQMELQSTTVNVDEALVLSAIENLLVNADEATAGKGTIVVRVHHDHRPRIEIEDNGTGMNAREKRAALEDFHTTKSTGSGLGLPFVHRVMESHGGYLALEDSEGGGLRAVLCFS